MALLTNANLNLKSQYDQRTFNEIEINFNETLVGWKGMH